MNAEPAQAHFVEPEDKGSIAYAVLVLEGVGNLFAWKVFTTAAGYYSARFCGSAFEYSFENYFSIGYSLPLLVGLALSTFYSDVISLDTKIVWPLIFDASLVALSTILVTVDIGANSLFWLSFLSTCLCGFVTAFLQAGLFGLSALLPPKYTAALMSGQSVAGLIVSFSSLMTTLSSEPKNPLCTAESGGFNDAVVGCAFKVDYSAFSYFLIDTLVLIACLYGYYFVLKNLQFVKYHLAKVEVIDPTHKPGTNVSINPMIELSVIKSSGELENRSITPTERPDRLQINTSPSTTHDMKSGEVVGLKRIYSVFMEIRTPALSVMGVFVVSIGLFPSLIVLIESVERCNSSNRFHGDLFIPFLFLIYNLFDVVGRMSAGVCQLLTASNIWIASAIRVIFFPLLLLCNVANSRLPVVFKSDAWPIIFVVLLAFSGGYVASICMMIGPGLTSSPNNKPLAGTIMTFCLIFGLVLGALISFIVVAISQGSV